MKKTALCLAVLLLPAISPAAEDDPEPKSRAIKPREIVATGLPGGRGNYDTPPVIPSEKHLREVIPDEAARAAILKQVDFRKEWLVLFSWSGSGGDRITSAEAKAGEANFVYTGGEAANCAQHAKLFAIPIRAKVKVTLR